MLGPSLQGIVNGLADRLGLPVVLEDANQQLLVYSPHYDITDRVREETILRRATTQRIVDMFGSYQLASREDPFVVAGDSTAGTLPRLCVPVRYLDAVLGYAWVLLPSGVADADTLAAAAEAGDQLSLVLLADSRVRALESDSLLSLVSSDADSRVQGLMDVEARGGFEAPRRLTVVVVTGSGWDDVGVRGSFWTAAWSPEPRYQLRGLTSREGVALISVRDELDEEHEGLLGRALQHVRRQSPHGRLVIGVGSTVPTPDRAHESYRQARLAARVALRPTRVGAVAWWDRLGVYRFLSQLPVQTLIDGVDPRMASLVEQHPIYAGTLETFLDHGGAIASVAEGLHIHRTTLYYRLDRIRDLGLDPSSGADRLTITTSFAALRLLGAWAGSDDDR